MTTALGGRMLGAFAAALAAAACSTEDQRLAKLSKVKRKTESMRRHKELSGIERFLHCHATRYASILNVVSEQPGGQAAAAAANGVQVVALWPA